MRRGGSGCASKLCGGPECDCGSYLQDNFDPLLRLLSAAVPGPVHHYAFCVNHGNCGALFRPESSHFAHFTTNMTTGIITSTLTFAHLLIDFIAIFTTASSSLQGHGHGNPSRFKLPRGTRINTSSAKHVFTVVARDYVAQPAYSLLV